MRKSAVLTAVLTAVTTLSGCVSVSPPEVPPEPALAEAATPPAPEEPPQPEALEPPTTPRRPQTIRIDNTSIESFRASWERMRASLSPAQQTDLNNAVVEITFADYGDATQLPPNLRNSPIVPEMVRHRIAGLTYAEIIALSP